mmetsp:Transcript_18296/g.22431  ORF Transcript_18296/g.22431 Transcript_18296/m.22431 type:complete len:222 (-) Transcript_18296:15-680(-)
MSTKGWSNIASSPATAFLQKKYSKTAKWYDILDAPWEKVYAEKIRPFVIGELTGQDILEAGVGTGRNLAFYNTEKCQQVTAFDLSKEMLHVASTRIPQKLKVSLRLDDATTLRTFNDRSFDVYVSTFLFCVLPNSCQQDAVGQMVRVLKPGGKFRIVEMVYSKDPWTYAKQLFCIPYVRWMYGAGFDKRTLDILQNRTDIKITNSKFLHLDTYLFVEGEKL